MSEYLSAGDLAMLQISFLPKTHKGIADKAKREHWIGRRRGKTGGGFEYQIAALPQEIQDAIAEKHLMGMLAKSTAKPPVQKKKQSKPAVLRPSQAGLPLDTVIKGYNQKQIACAHVFGGRSTAYPPYERYAGA